MPDDPVMEASQTPQVQPSAELPANARPESFGAGVGNALENAAEVATRIHHDAYDQANQTAALDHSNAVEQWAQSNVYDPQNGALAKQSGKNAPAVVDATLKSFDDMASKQLETAANDQQRMAFQRVNQQKRFELEKHLGAYEHQQVTQYQDQTEQAAISNAATSATHAPYDAEHVQDQIGKMQAIIADRGARKGVAPEMVKVQQQEAASGTHLSVMEQMAADGNDAAAKQYFQAHQDQFYGNDLLKAKRLVEVGDRNDQARKVADDVLNTVYGKAVDGTGNFDESQVSMEKALTELNSRAKGMDTRVLDQARSRIIGDFKVRQEAHDDAQRSSLERVSTYLEDPANETAEVPANEYAKLDERYRRAVDLRQKQIREERQPQDDPDFRGRIYQMAADRDQWDDFVKIPDGEARPYLSDPSFRKFQAEKAHVQAQLDKDNDRLSQGAISFKVAQDLFHDLGMAQPEGAKPGSPQYEATRKLQDQFMDHLHRAVGEAQLEKKGNLSEDEIRKVANDLTAHTDWKVAPSWFDRNIPTPLTFGNLVTGGWIPDHIWDSTKAGGMAFQAPWADKLVYQKREIPESVRPQLLERLIKQGNPSPSDKDLIQAYNRGIEAQYRAGQQ